MSNLIIYLDDNSTIPIAVNTEDNVNYTVANGRLEKDREQLMYVKTYDANENYTLLLKPLVLSLKDKNIKKIQWVYNEEILAEMDDDLHFMYLLSIVPEMNFVQESVTFIYAAYDVGGLPNSHPLNEEE